MPLKLVPPRAGKTPYWYVRGTYLGRTVDKSTKAPERRVAKQVLERIKGEIERGEFARPAEPTFLKAAVAYMDAGGEATFVDPLLSHFKERSLASIDQAAIDEAAITLYPNASPATRNRQVYTPVSAILRRSGINLALKRPKGSGGAIVVEWFWPEQAFAIFKAADKIDAEFGLMVRLLCYTGLRLGEVLAIEVKDLRLAESFMFVGKTKNGDPRPVALTSALVKAIRKHPRGLKRSGRLFHFHKGGRLYGMLRDTWKAAGLTIPTRRGFHLFRHTWGTWMRRYSGLDTAGLVGTGAWADRKSASRYEHVVVSEEAAKVSLLPVETRTIRGKPKKT